MLRPLLSELTIRVEIESKSNLLIKDGRYTQKEKDEWCQGDQAQQKAAPSFIFVSRNRIEELKNVALNIGGELNRLDYYLPGASVRGAWRSHLEKVLRSLDNEKVCDPMASKKEDAGRVDVACSSRLMKGDERDPHPYLNSCPVCKLFGSTAHGSRLAISDGERMPTVRKEKGKEAGEKTGTAILVDNVAISRQTGSVISPFKSVTLHGAKFALEMRLRNFELWQVGLLGHLFDDLQARRVPLGSGKNKGFGVVEAKATKMNVVYYGSAPAQRKLYGLRERLREEERERRAAEYGLKAEEPVDVSGISKAGEGETLWRRDFMITDPAAFWNLVKPRFSRMVWDGLTGPKAQAARA